MIFEYKMRRLILYILIICSNISIAQYINYKDDSGWNLGLNIGGSWQRAEKYSNNYDTAYSTPFAGFSRGFTFGKSIYEKEDKFFSLFTSESFRTDTLFPGRGIFFFSKPKNSPVPHADTITPINM